MRKSEKGFYCNAHLAQRATIEPAGENVVLKFIFAVTGIVTHHGFA